jgi:hypothetical protein
MPLSSRRDASGRHDPVVGPLGASNALLVPRRSGPFQEPPSRRTERKIRGSSPECHPLHVLMRSRSGAVIFSLNVNRNIAVEPMRTTGMKAARVAAKNKGTDGDASFRLAAVLKLDTSPTRPTESFPREQIMQQRPGHDASRNPRRLEFDRPEQPRDRQVQRDQSPRGRPRLRPGQW